MRVRKDMAIYFAMQPLDFRKAIDGLAMEVGRALGRDPMSGELFVFHNRSRTALKALYWTPKGFVMLYKRLECGRFCLPSLADATDDIMLEPGVLQGLLDGLTRSI